MEKTCSAGLRFACLAGAVFIYALFGSPTPDAPGAAEIMVAGLLILAAGIPGFHAALGPRSPRFLWEAAGRVLLVYGLGISLVVGALQGHGVSLMLRDIVPFIFFLLPLFLHDIFHRRPDLIKPFAMLVVFSGVVFSVRAVPEIIGWWRSDYEGELYYFANAPTLLFAALFLAGYGIHIFLHQLWPRFTVRDVGSGVLCLAGLLPLAAITATLQRASLGVFLCGAMVFVVVGLYRSPYRMILLLILTGLALWPFWNDVSPLLADMLHKTGDVGLNMRDEEFAAAWREISGSPLTFFFGTGWGGTFESPAVGGLRVNYTHSLLSAMLLKTGLFGLVLGAAYLAGLAAVLWDLMRRNMVMAVALGGPLAIDVLLYASYKSLDFGLILLLIAACGPVVKVASRHRVLYSNLYSRINAE